MVASAKAKRSAGRREYIPPGFGFDCRTAVTKHFLCVLDGLSANVVQVHRQKIQHVSEFMKERECLSGQSAALVQSNVHEA